MARQSKQIEDEAPAGAPDWMVTFSDCMTLLLTFFVLLLSFATFHEETLPALGRAFQHALPSVGNSQKTEVDSVYEKEETKNSERVDKGTETKPLLQTPDNARPQAEQKPLDFKNLKVFCVDSSRFFWGEATAISAEGRLVLDALAQFLHSQPSRVVISENGPPGTLELGLDRAWAIVEYLAGSDCEQPVPREKFSVTGSTMMRQGPSDTRRVEITLLEKSLYE
ncbi:MAG: hypothetical protein JXA82_11535 [Sedimentisphaerales bacterium]|nr:hypothetical protein [Sedimentisphaerales bacterium]